MLAQLPDVPTFDIYCIIYAETCVARDVNAPYCLFPFRPSAIACFGSTKLSSKWDLTETRQSFHLRERRGSPAPAPSPLRPSAQSRYYTKGYFCNGQASAPSPDMITYGKLLLISYIYFLAPCKSTRACFSDARKTRFSQLCRPAKFSDAMALQLWCNSMVLPTQGAVVVQVHLFLTC